MRKRKLFVVTAGTVAAGVGQELERQILARPENGLRVMVRYVDTARLVNRYPDIRDGEWFQMKVDPAHMKAIALERKRYPRLDQLLYDNKLLPRPTGHGGGSIRYNGAGSVVVNRDKMKKWLSANMTSLMRLEDGQTNFSVAIIASSVGATGSGSLEQLADVVAEAAAEASVPLPIQIDFFILQPGMEGVNQLGLANTLALYTELAATRLAQDEVGDKDYQGRIVMVGWGSQRMLSSIEQLQETAATLVRLVNDNASNIVAEYQERAVDNHVLLQIDELTGLPSHLSTATPVTISLGGLEEQIIQRDAARLIDNLVFGTETGGPANVVRQELFLGTLKDAMDGSTPDERYSSLLSYLAEDAGAEPRCLNKRFRDQIITSQPQDMLPRLEGAWNNDKNAIAQSVTEMRSSGSKLIRDISGGWNKLRNDTMATSSDLSLSSLQREYRYLSGVLNEVLKFARNETAFIDDNAVMTQFKQLELAAKANNRGAERNRLAAADSAIRQVQRNIRAQLERRASPIAIDVLEELTYLSSEALNNLEAVLLRLQKQKETLESWSVTRRPLSAGVAHPLELVALSYEKKGNEPSEVESYYNHVSILDSRTRGRTKQTNEIDQLASFRKWLSDSDHLEDLFKGDIELLLRVAQDYTRTQVHEEIKKNSVLDILIQSDEQTLSKRLSEAADLAYPLVNFNEGFAPDREEVWHVCAYWKDTGQRDTLQKVVDKVFGQGRCTLLESSDPTEIAVFYYVDGIPMSAVNDLTGRCLESFLKLRQNWYRYSGTASSNGSVDNPGQRVSIPIYSGKDVETLVLDKDIIGKLCKVAERYARQFPNLLELKNFSHGPDQH